MRKQLSLYLYAVWISRFLLFNEQLGLITGWFFAGNNPQRKNLDSIVPSNIKLLILPGFGNDSSDYLLEQTPQGSLVKSLLNRGWQNEQIYILPVKRPDWLQVFTSGLFDLQFWQGIAPPTRPSFRWYIKRIVDGVNEITNTNDSDGDTSNVNKRKPVKVVLIGHSAGGWLGRAAIGYGSVGDDPNSFIRCIDLTKVCGIVTLGTPNLPPPPDVMDMTRGALKLTSIQFPGAYHDELFYLTVIGDAVQGVKQERKTPFERTSIPGFAYNSYEAVCGDGEQIGDGVVPMISGHLDGAVQINLDGIFHSINEPDKWYGSDSVIDDWHQEMLHQIAQRSNATNFRLENNFFSKKKRYFDY
jgi:hypothetical protein